ncbi:hypothetical protein VIOR3934_20115 [Vibrio orientalis CIP 102891 = ATCC 33934]|uniref:Uncharacterized protein n=1 Tax=Vibrio orientalis CIP 102891 = ATCC 33934 TaxID=675816 RepID=C9QFU3_VIBOR|nr:hypothetical protein [Vibrio orientalis]EEX94288.1 hypothetical protein VIA_001446 [Vibrio orientalis CIP 102891 = ATCC 33934]EGU54168.1 hypothetical protein VIOR3934_20115 [Vibrio orientalis CIP 102891 = ATCC 33934]
MTELEQQLNNIQAGSLSTIESDRKSFELFIEKHNALFKRACGRKPDIAPVQHLLGVLTKAHIEETSHIESQSESAAAMRKVFDENLGKEHTHKFEELGSRQFALVTHLWLYCQGYLRMDFSLANDHAFNSATLLSTTTLASTQELRTQFLESFYLGNERSPIAARTPSKLSQWFKRLFS